MTAKEVAEKDIRKFLRSIGKTYINVSIKALRNHTIIMHELSG